MQKPTQAKEIMCKWKHLLGTSVKCREREKVLIEVEVKNMDKEEHKKKHEWLQLLQILNRTHHELVKTARLLILTLFCS